MKIGIHSREIKNDNSSIIDQVINELHRRNIEIHLSDQLAMQLKESPPQHITSVFTKTKKPQAFDFFLSLGGDGTLLDSVIYVGKTETPIVGINLGRLGFLATLSRHETKQAIDDLITGAYKLDKRIAISLLSSRPLFSDFPYALNDFIIMKKNTSSMVTVHVYVDHNKLNTYWADGLIISTPTGSTGYSLSCGGPLIYPQSNNFVITAVSSHNLGTRPIIIPDTSIITLKIEGRDKKYMISLDSRVEKTHLDTEFTICKADFHINLVQRVGQHYFQTLRQKLNWGIDIRN